MKRAGGLFREISTRENLAHAFRAASCGKRERSEVREFESRLDENLARMGRLLAGGEYRFSGYREFEVRDTKRRTIHAPVFADRVAHHALIRVAGPVLERGALEHSYACRAGRGQHRALNRAREWTRRSGWYGKMDVRRFYDSVSHAILRGLLARRFRERSLLNLFDAVLASYSVAPGCGLPIGALTSQYLGNFMLDSLDHAMKATGRAQRYLRYMDDAVVWAPRDDLPMLRDTAVAALDRLGLELKHGGEWNRCSQGVPFLGFVLYPDRMRLNRAGRKRLRRKFRGLERARQVGHVENLTARAEALFAHARSSDDLAWRQAVLAIHDFGEGQGPRPARRLVEQRRQELPLGVSQQEQAGQPQQEQRIPAGFGPRHGEAVPSPDDASSRAPRHERWAETTGKTPPRPETAGGACRKGRGGAPLGEQGGRQ